MQLAFITKIITKLDCIKDLLPLHAPHHDLCITIIIGRFWDFASANALSSVNHVI